MKLFASISATVIGATDTVVVGGIVGLRIRVTHFVLYDIADGWQFMSSSTPLMGQSNGMQAGGANFPPWSFKDEGGLFQTEPGEDLVLHTNSGSSRRVSGHITYEVGE